MPQVEREYIETGKLRYIVRDFPLDFHPFAFKAAEASHCAGEQGRFWPMHQQLFANYRALSPDDLPQHAEAVGLNVPRFQQCLDSDRFAARVQQGLADGEQLGVSGTPYFMVGVEKPGEPGLEIVRSFSGARAFDSFKRLFDALLRAEGQGN